MAGKVNKNDEPLRKREDLAGSVTWGRYKRRKLFRRLCVLAPNRDRERLEIIRVQDEKKMRQEGLVYAIVVDNRIFKIGHSIRSFRDRLGSYNTGKVRYRLHGTNSGANYFILQSLLNIGMEITIYGFFPERRTWKFMGETGTEPFPSSKVVEGLILREFKKTYAALPIGCSQS